MLAWAANSGGGGKVRPSCMSASIVAASATSLTLVLLPPLLTNLQLRRHAPVPTDTLPPRQRYCQQEGLLTVNIVCERWTVTVRLPKPSIATAQLQETGGAAALESAPTRR